MGEHTVRVRVTPDARKESLIEIKPNVLAISVKEGAERGEANARVKTLVARHYGVNESRVRLHTGHTSRSKVFNIV